MTHKNLIDAFLLKLRFNLKAEAQNTYLSYIWWLLEPAILVIVFYVVFEILLNRGVDNFLLFLLCGKIPFLWFAKSVNNAANSITAGRGLINQMAIPKPFFPLLIVAQDLVKQVFVMLALLVLVAVMGFAPGPAWLLIPPIMACQFLLIIAGALCASAIVPYIPDFKHIIPTAMTMLLFGSGIFYDYRTALHPEFQQYFLWNPVARLIEAYRDVLIRDSLPDLQGLLVIAIGSLLVIMLLAAWFRRNDETYARLIIQ